MPLLESSYRPRGLFRNAHASTVIPSLLRRVLAVSYVRERMEPPDGDFIDLDWSRVGAQRVAVLCHGLEGNADRPYMRGMARTLNRASWDVVGYNFRSCSGEPNRLARSYHSGATDDLRLVLAEVLGGGYEEAALVGFSLGGNLVLKYLGEDPGAVPTEITGAVTLSVPADLNEACHRICSPGNRLYHDRFMRKLRKKILAKDTRHPGLLDPSRLVGVRNLIDFDDVYTAPLHGFVDAADYYARNSSLNWLADIRVPTLLLSASNDPMLGENCYPRELARESGHLHLEMPDHGGHVGYYQRGGVYFSEARAVDFLERHA